MWIVFLIVALLALIGMLIPLLYSSKSVEEQVVEANYCATKSDCVLVASKCPFGCAVFVNKDEARRMKGLIEAYPSECMYSCLPLKGFECIGARCQAFY